MLDWTRFRIGNMGPEKAFETFSAQLFERWLHRQRQPAPTSYTLHGAGGDGGVEAFAELSSGAVVGLQAKWFSGNIRAAEIKKIRDSLDSAAVTFPGLTQYVVALRQNLTKARNKNEKGGVERWDEFVKSAKAAYPGIEVIRWDEAGLLDQLAQPANQELRALWFEGEFTMAKITLAWEKTHRRLRDRYLPNLHAVGAIDALIEADLWTPQTVARGGQGLERARVALTEAATELTCFIRLTDGREATGVSAAAAEAAATITALLRHEVMLRGVLSSGPQPALPAGPTVDPLDDFDDLLEDFEKHPAGTYTVHHATLALVRAREACAYIEQIDESLRGSARPRVIVGPAGCGKTHAAANGVHRHVADGSPCVLILAKDCAPRDGARRLLGEALDAPGWPLARTLDALEALAVHRQAAVGYQLGADAGFVRALIVIDGLEEAPDAVRWVDVLIDLEVELARRPRVHLIATARPEFHRAAALPESFGHVLLEEKAKVDLPVLLATYAREYRVGVEAVPWLGWALRSPLEVRLLAEEFRDKSVSAAEGANANMLTLFDRKLDRIEQDARRRAGADTWSDGLGLLLATLTVISDKTADGGQAQLADPEVVTAVVASEDEFTARRVRFALTVLQEHGLVDRHVPRAGGLARPAPVWSLATRHLSDFMLARRLAELTLATLREGAPLAYPEALDRRTAAGVLFAARLAERGQFVADLPWVEPPPDLRPIHAQALGLIPRALAATRRDEIVAWLVESTALNRAIVRGLVLPVSRVPGHPLGPITLDEALRRLTMADRDPVWSVPEDLDGDGPWHRCWDEILDRVELAAGDPWDGPPLLAAWTTSTVVEARRRSARAALAVWGAGRLGEMVALLRHMATVDDPQVLDDCVVAALGAALGAPLDDPALPVLAKLMDALFFAPDASAYTESVPVRVAARGVVERAALADPETLAGELARARPPYPPRGGFPAVDPEELRQDPQWGAGIVTRDLSWYVAERGYRYFDMEASEPAGPPEAAAEVDGRLLQAIDDGALVAPAVRAARRADARTALRAVFGDEGGSEQTILDDLLEPIRAWFAERTSKDPAGLSADVLLGWVRDQPEAKAVADLERVGPAYSAELRALLAQLGADLGAPTPSPRAVGNAMIAQMVKTWGWSRDRFAHSRWEKPFAVVDDAICAAHGSGKTHGERSPVCRFREKYVWAAVDRVAGALADRLPVWEGEAGRWERLTSLNGLGHGLPDPLPQLNQNDDHTDNLRAAWAPAGTLVDQFVEVDGLGLRAERWLTEGAHPDPRTFLGGAIEAWPDAVVLAFTHHRRGHQGCMDQLVQARAFGARPGDLDLLRRDAPFVLLEHANGGASVGGGGYGSPALACAAPWLPWEGIDQGYLSFTEAGAPRHVELRAAVATITARFEGDWPQETEVAMLAPDLARALGVSGMQGGRRLRRYVDRRGQAVAIERDVKPLYYGFNHHTLVANRSRVVAAFATEGLVPVWVVRVCREATPALFMHGHSFRLRAGLVHKCRDIVWLVIGDPAHHQEVVQLADRLAPFERVSSLDGEGEE